MEILTDTKFSVVILCPDCNYAGLRYTVNSLKNDFAGVPYFAMVGKNAHPDNFKEMSKICKVHKAGKTITSLIDVGIRTIAREWGIIITSGSRFRFNMFKKYSYFVKSNKDIMFPVLENKYFFDEGSINGIVMNKNAILEVGEFGDNNENIQEAKLYWAAKAIEKGYKFKGLVGAKLI